MQPDKRMYLKGEDDKGKPLPALPTMPMFDDDEVDNNSSGDDYVSINDGGSSEGGDTEILASCSENSDGSRSDHESEPVLKKTKKTEKKNVTGKKQNKKDSSRLVVKTTKPAKKNVNETKPKKALGQSSISKPDQEVSAINLSSKSAKVLLLSYSGESAVENISREYLYEIIKDLGGKVSLAKQLQGDALFKAVAVKLVNHGRVKIKTEASLPNLKLSDIIIK